MKHAQKLISIILMVTMLIGVISIFPMNIDATSNIIIGGVDIGYAVGDYFTKNGKTCLTSAFSNGTCHGHGICITNTDSRCNCLRYWPSKENCQVDLQATQCFGFARYCQWKVYGYHDGNASSRFTDITGRIDAINCTADTLKSKLLDCPVATHIRTGDDGHSMVVVSTSNTSIQIVSCNKDGTCVIISKNYTWAGFAEYLKGRSGISYSKAVEGSSTTSQVSTNPDDYTYPTSTIYRTSPTMKGSTVAWVQAVLYQLGYSIEIDGSYGANSETVVKQFQSANGLEVDGRVGPATRAKLLELWNAKKADDTHTCNQYGYCIENAHPHYTYYKCSICGEVTSEKKAGTFPECDICYPPIENVWMNCSKTELKIGDSNTFTFGADNAETYHIGLDKDGVRILTQKVDSGFTITFTDSGNYSAYVTCAAKNRTSVDSNKVYFEVTEQITTLPTLDEHIHNYSTKYYPSDCGNYGITYYTCDCGDIYTEYDTELGEHESLQMKLMEQADSCVGFDYEYCQVCNLMLDFKAVYPDGSAKSLPLPENAEYYSGLRVLLDEMIDILVDFDLKASLSADNEKTIEFSWATDDETISTEEIDYYEFSIYYNNELIETVETSTPDCAWEFDSNQWNYNVVVTGFNANGDVIAISSLFTVTIDVLLVDCFDYYGNVDRKGDINVKDATLIQKYLANLVELEEYPLMLADVNSDGKVNIKDSTAIQKYCAKIYVDSRISNECWYGYADYSGVRVEPTR